MKMPAILFLFLYFSFPVIAQQTIKGRVVNAATGNPIQGSSVFISNSSKGTTTDNMGQFELTNIPPGKQDLIISYIGYETNVYSFTQDQLPLRLKVEMTLKVKEMENVTLEESVEEGWDKWGKTFIDYFVGTTENAVQCKIINGKAIKFRYYKKTKRLVAYSDEPILLENKALGYNIHYQLEDFEINFSDHSFLYVGYPLFQDMNVPGKAPRQKWKNNRETAYNGSITHFMKSIFDNQLQQNGFDVRRVVRVPNLEKERVKVIQTAAFKSQSFGTGTIIIKDPLAGLPTDSITYYREVMKQNDYKEIIGKSLLTADSLIIKSTGDYKAIYFPDYIFIIFKNAMEEDYYARMMYPSRKAGMQQTYVNIQGDNYLTVDKIGNYYNPKFFYTSGYWGFSQKMANMLPVDYMEAEK